MRSIRQSPSSRPPLQGDLWSARPPSVPLVVIPTPANLSLQQANFHKRTYSDCKDFGTAEKRTRRHQRSSSQIFTCGLVEEKVPWGRRIITEVEEEEWSESEEIIRRILRERKQRIGNRRRPVAYRETSIQNFRSSMSQLLSIQAEEAKRTELARARLKREILDLVQSPLADSSRADSPETVITLKSSAASVTTVVEALSESEGPASEETAIPVEEDKGSETDLSGTICSEGQNTVITDQEAVGGNRTQRLGNWEVVKSAIASTCFHSEFHCFQAFFRQLESQQPSHSLVLAFFNPPIKRQSCALYELCEGQLLRKVYGRREFREIVGPEQVRNCYCFDSDLVVFHQLRSRRVGEGVHAVVL